MRLLALSFFSACFAFTFGTPDTPTEPVMVKMVQQRYEAEINEKLIDQIQRELTASFIYQAYASYFQRADVSLPGIQKFFSEASKEERDHAQMLIDYVNKRGGHAQFKNLNLLSSCETIKKNAEARTVGGNAKTRMCICSFLSTKFNSTLCGNRDDWQSGLMAFEDALIIERYVNKKLLELHGEAETFEDADLVYILEHHFLDEQVTSIYQLGHFVTRLRSFGSNYKLGEYIFDQNLK